MTLDEITDPAFIEKAMQAVNDLYIHLDHYARSVSEKQRLAIAALADAAEQTAKDRIKALEARLEIDHYFTSDAEGNEIRVEGNMGIDGIAARDATIALMQERISELEGADPFPALGAAAMRKEVVFRIKAVCRLLHAAGYEKFADRVSELVPSIEDIPLPDETALTADAMRLPKFAALKAAVAEVTKIKAHMADFDGDKRGHYMALDEAAQAVFQIAIELATPEGGA